MQGTVKYSEEFMTMTGLKRWVGIELPFEDTIHSPIDKLEEAMSKVQSFAARSGIIHPPVTNANYGYPNLLNPDEQLPVIQVREQY